MARDAAEGNGARGIAVDSSGNIYVTGDGDEGIYTIKYDSAGNEFPDQFGLHTGARDGSSIVLNSSANVYVVGNGLDIIKYLPDGTVDWAWDRSGFQSFAVDSSENVYVAGLTDDGNFLAAKYLPDGTVATGWPQYYDGCEWGNTMGLQVDSAGNVYVLGSGTDVVGPDIDPSEYYSVTLKYNAGGELLWHNETPLSPNSYPNVMELDSAGNVYVSGYWSPGIDEENDTFIIKYDTDGNKQWTVSYDYGNYGYRDIPMGISMDPSGDYLYVVGKNKSSFGSDLTVVKYDAVDGTMLCDARYAGLEIHDFDKHQAVDQSGNIYVAASTAGGDNRDYVTVRYNRDCNAQGELDLAWVMTYDGGYGDFVYGMAVDSADNVYVTGGSYSPKSGFGYATVKYSQGEGDGSVALPDSVNLLVAGEVIDSTPR
ncbi:MAG: SBBP repeat-containing protein [Thermodesulfobacteriota bacterium]